MCLQPLPTGINEAAIQARIQKLAAPTLESEKKRLQEEYSAKLRATEDETRQKLQRKFQLSLRAAETRARQDAERRAKAQLADVKKRANQAEARIRKEFDQARKQEQVRLKREAALDARRDAQQSEAALEKLKIQHNRERIRYEESIGNLKGQLEDVSRKLEKRSGEQFGTEAERDLHKELTDAFPGDRIGRIGRGVKGADIEHKVMDGAKVAGIIVYESKNTSKWDKKFIAQAKKYRTQYMTPHVMIVSRVLPPKHTGLCVQSGVPVVDVCMAVELATIIREGVIEIAKLKLTGSFNEDKSRELYEYVVSDKFCTRFRQIADQIVSLQELQNREKTSHERVWEEESRIHETIRGSHVTVEAQIDAIVKGGSSKRGQKIPLRAETWGISGNGKALSSY